MLAKKVGTPSFKFSAKTTPKLKEKFIFKLTSASPSNLSVKRNKKSKTLNLESLEPLEAPLQPVLKAYSNSYNQSPSVVDIPAVLKSGLTSPITPSNRSFKDKTCNESKDLSPYSNVAFNDNAQNTLKPLNETSISNSCIPASNSSSMISLNQKGKLTSNIFGLLDAKSKFATFRSPKAINFTSSLNLYNDSFLDENEDTFLDFDENSDVFSESSYVTANSNLTTATIRSRGAILSSTSVNSLQHFSEPVLSSSPRYSLLYELEGTPNFYGQYSAPMSSDCSYENSILTCNLNGTSPFEDAEERKPLRTSLSACDLNTMSLMKELTANVQKPKLEQNLKEMPVIKKPLLPVKPSNLKLKVPKALSNLNACSTKEINNNCVNFKSKELVAAGVKTNKEISNEDCKPKTWSSSSLQTPLVKKRSGSITLNKVQQLVDVFNNSSISKAMSPLANSKSNSDWQIAKKRNDRGVSTSSSKSTASHRGSCSDFLQKKSLLESKLPPMINAMGGNEGRTEL